MFGIILHINIYFNIIGLQTKISFYLLNKTKESGRMITDLVYTYTFVIFARIAAFGSFCENCAMIWVLTCLTEVFVVKALMLYKFNIMAGLDDSFLSRFLFLVNLGFMFLSQLPRFHLGGLYQSLEFQILSGNLFHFSHLNITHKSTVGSTYL